MHALLWGRVRPGTDDAQPDFTMRLPDTGRP